METRAHHVVIGLFTLIVVSAALLFCLWLTNAGSDRQFNLYDIVFNEPVSGLSQGSTVGSVSAKSPSYVWTEKTPTKFGRGYAYRRQRQSAKILKHA